MDKQNLFDEEILTSFKIGDIISFNFTNKSTKFKNFIARLLKSVLISE